MSFVARSSSAPRLLLRAEAAWSAISPSKSSISPINRTLRPPWRSSSIVRKAAVGASSSSSLLCEIVRAAAVGLPTRLAVAARRSGTTMGKSNIKAVSRLSSARCERCFAYVIKEPLAVAFAGRSWL